MNYLRVAHAKAPWAAPVNFYLGESYRMIGDKQSSARYLENARNWATDGLWRRRAATALKRLEADPADS